MSSAMSDLPGRRGLPQSIRSYCSFVVRASGKSRLRLRASSSAIPLSLRGVRGGEKATVLAVLHVFAARFRARANSHRFGKKLLAISLGQDRERRRARDLPRSLAVLMFITMLTDVFTLAASPALPTKRIWAASSFKIGSAFRNASSFPPHIR